jgi:nitrate reductase gamma subunit
MGHGESSLLPIAEIAHWIGLLIMMTVYTARLVWIFRFKAGRDRQAKGERAAENAANLGALYSLGNIAMPWAMESTRKNLPFYLSFALFHIGVTFGIVLAFTNPIAVLHETVIGWVFIVTVGVAFLISLVRIVRRFTLPHMKLISTPDDYFSLFMLTVWFGLGVISEYFRVTGAATETSELWLALFLFATTFFLVYVPFSKISHYLYYPLTRYWLGRTLGHRGSIPFARAR